MTETADGFRGFEHAFRDAAIQRDQTAVDDAAKHRKDHIAALMKAHVSDTAWQALLDLAQRAAAHGAKDYLLLRFPSELCTDDSRAINNPPNDTWPQTLRGEALEMYQRWDATLRPHGFHLAAQVLDFPGGKPGDVGLFLRWGE